MYVVLISKQKISMGLRQGTGSNDIILLCVIYDILKNKKDENMLFIRYMNIEHARQ